MSHFNIKTLTFYGIAIGSVTLLFKVVTAYGETNLKAAPAIAGSYSFDAKNLPECLKSDDLVLTIEQSGVYLSGNLKSNNNSVDRQKTNPEKPTLAGKWENQGLSLSGAVPNLTGCGKSTGDGSQNSLVKLRGVVEGESLKGKISLVENAVATDFMAQKVKKREQQPEQGH
ncbi:MAG: hypothetical protein ACBR12_07320 [Microcoleus sp.]|uniref:hypothetical protein n=1 Tax=Microcoleus sp. CAWBG640 TaxID=2841653 RepID=UPI00312B7786